MTNHKHTIEACRMRYEGNTEFDLSDIAKWSGYTYSHIRRVAGKQGWECGKALHEATEKGLKKQADNQIDKLLKFKASSDRSLQNALGWAYETLAEVYAKGEFMYDEDGKPRQPLKHFDRLKCNKIYSEIVINTYKVLGLFEDKPESNNKIEVIITDDHE